MVPIRITEPTDRGRKSDSRLPGFARKARSDEAYRVRLLDRKFMRIYSDALASLHLRGLHFLLLGVLHQRGPSSLAELREITHMRVSTISRNLNLMRKRKWLAKVSDKKNRRGIISITKEGRLMLRTAHPLWKKAQHEALRALGPDGCRALDALTKRLVG
jgi:DNA-binding MarR family transcriptional regulator